MRSTNWFLVLIIVFGLLLFLVLMQNKGKEKEFEEQQAAKEVLFYPDFNPDAVARIRVEKLQDSLDFKKEGAYWMVANVGQSPILMESIEEGSEESGEEVEEDGEDETPGDGDEEASEEETEETEENLRHFRADETMLEGILGAIESM